MGTRLELDAYIFQNIVVNVEQKGAIVAHPYATLGGCYDDPVVNFTGSEILKQGLILVTFNFRYDQLH
jgi:alpha/beta superfamily hydrolase